MSLPTNILNAGLANGVYKIFNVQYPDQVADLIYPGGANGTIVGYGSGNDPSKRVQWQVTNVLDVFQNQITLTNQEITTYAYALQRDINLQVVGNPDPQIWSVNPTPTVDHYYILMGETFTWTLEDGNDGTPITLKPFSTPTDESQLWKFVPVN